MAEILIVGRDAPEATALGAALNAQGWACKTECLDTSASSILERVRPAVTVLVFRPGDEDQDRDQVGQWMRGPRQLIGWLLVPEAEIDQAIEQLSSIIETRGTTWFSADSSVEEIVDLVTKIAKSGRPSRMAASSGAKHLLGMRLRAARDIAGSLRELLPRLSFVRKSERARAARPEQVLKELEALLARVRLLKLAQGHMANLEKVAAEDGPRDWRLQRIVRVSRVRLEKAITSDEIAFVNSLARGGKRAIDKLMLESRIAKLVQFSERSLAEAGVGPEQAKEAATTLMRKLLRIAAQHLRKDETSSADLIHVVMWDAIRRFWRLRGARELKEVDESEVRPTDDRDEEGTPSRKLPIAPEFVDGEGYWPVSWAAQIVRVSAKTVHGWIAAGKVASVEVQGRRHLDAAGLLRLRALKEAAGRAQRSHDPEGKLLTVSQVIRVTRAQSPKKFERLRQKQKRAADALGITGVRTRFGRRLFTLDEARRLRRAIGVDHDDE